MGLDAASLCHEEVYIVIIDLIKATKISLVLLIYFLQIFFFRMYLFF